jgi:Tfp pilus assembly protein PilF
MAMRPVERSSETSTRDFGSPPDAVSHWMQDGVTAHQQGEIERAIAAYAKVVGNDPVHQGALSNLPVAYRQLEQLAVAAALYQRSLNVNPDDAGTLSNYSGTLRMLARLDEALAAAERAVSLQPEELSFWFNLGLVLDHLGHAERAAAVFQRCYLGDPTNLKAHLDWARSLLKAGRLREGFEQYECRFPLHHWLQREYPQPRWQRPDEAITGQFVLVHCEQGMGDALMFSRYIELLLLQDPAVLIFECPAPLKTLFAAQPWPVRVVGQGEPLPEFERYVSLMSLPYLCQTTLDTLPATIPYLRPPSGEMPGHCCLPVMAGKKVGLVWNSSHQDPGAANRCLPFDQCLRLLAVPGIQWVSLQKGPGEEMLAQHQVAPLLMNYGARVRDFSDTAHVVSQLDLVITTDTAVAHLAGAMGKPVWTLLPFAAEWRWLEPQWLTSPWYPTMRLFRCQQPGSWPAVFTEVLDALTTWVKDTQGET